MPSNTGWSFWIVTQFHPICGTLSYWLDGLKGLTSPLIKKDGDFVEATWEEALDLVVGKLSSHKGSEFAGLSSARTTNEDNYVFQKFVRSVMGTNNVDHCARL